MRFDIVTLGSATIDHFADTDSELVQIETSHSIERLIAYPLGSKILVRELHTTIGGGGTNTAVAFARLGFNTAYLGKVGDDSHGDEILAALEQEQVSFVGARGGQSGLSVILDSIHDDRTILAFKGCNDNLSPQEAKLPDCDWLYCGAMLGQSLDTVKALIPQVQAQVAFNPSTYLAKLGAEALAPILAHTQALILNREEACLLLGLDPNEQLDESGLPDRLRQLGPAIVVVTDGANGLWAGDGSQCLHARPSDQLHIVETTGAGDAFGSGFVAGLARGLSLEQSLRMGMLNAESVMAFKGAKNYLLRGPDMAKRLDKDNRVIEPCGEEA
ncbi:carbohydrate kinase family protein [Gallaecimonas sp. GXIMD4217]|uniref:carbohydrate kinase family protein n=1 Tax=Gallaecimonas sp. GXIMD4217 TaxID=3131927 RepID=UPI00311B1F67